MLQIVNPADGSLITELVEDPSASIHEKAQRAREAQPSWAAAPFAERARVIAKFRQLLLDNADALATTLTDEVGKPITQSLSEIKGVPARIDFFLEQTEKVIGTETLLDDASQKL